MISPIEPDEVIEKKREVSIPDDVFKAFNDLIAQNYKRGSAKVMQDDVVAVLIGMGHSESEIFDKNWLDVEEIYEGVGWKVQYDKPGYCETYDAYFVFRK